MPKGHFMPVVRLDQDQIATEGAALSNVTILNVTTNQTLWSGPAGQTPVEYVDAGNINTVLSSAGGSGWTKQQATAASTVITRPASGASLDLHIEAGGSLAALSTANWPIPASGVDQIKIRNFSGVTQTFTVTTGAGQFSGLALTVPEDANALDTSYTIPAGSDGYTPTLLVQIDPDGWVQAQLIGAEVSQAEFATHADSATTHVTSAEKVEWAAKQARNYDPHVESLARTVHLRPETLVGVAGDVVASWANDGTGDDMAQATTTRQPKLSVGVNGRLGVDFTDDAIGNAVDATLFTSAFSLFLVGHTDVTGSYRRAVTATAATAGPLSFGKDSASKLNIGRPGVAESTGTHDLALLADTTHIMGFQSATGIVSGGITCKLFLDGTPGTNQSFASGVPTPTGVLLGATGSVASPSEFWDGDMNEILIVPSDLSDTDRQVIEGYLAHKFAITSQLPASHPWKSVVPPAMEVSRVRNAVTQASVDAGMATKASAKVPIADYAATALYAVGDQVIQSNVLYECSTAITVAEAFTVAKWTAIGSTAGLADADAPIQAYSASALYAVGDQVIQSNVFYKCKTAIAVAEAFTASKWDAVSKPTLKTVNGNSLEGVGDIPSTTNITTSTFPSGLTAGANLTASAVLTAWNTQRAVDASGGDVHVILPTAVSQTGFLSIVRIDSSANNVWVYAQGLEGLAGLHALAAAVRVGPLGSVLFEATGNVATLRDWRNPLEVSRLWTLAELTGLAAWHSAEGLAALASGASIATWADASGNSRPLEQGTVGQQLTVHATRLNGYNVASLDGVDDRMVATFPATDWGTTPHMVLAVAFGAVDGRDLIGTGAVSDGHLLIMKNANVVRGHAWRGATANTADGTTTWAASTWVIAGQRLSGAAPGTTLSTLLNGRVEANLTMTGTSGTGTATSFVLGTRGSGTFWSGRAAETLAVFADVSDAERQRAEGYWAHKFALRADLPATGHSYRNAPPIVSLATL